MSDKDKKPNTDDLVDVKSLIMGASQGDYTLEDIMKEYGHPAPKGKVVAFPGAAPPPEPEPEYVPEPIGPEPDLRDVAQDCRERYLSRKRSLLPPLLGPGL